MDIVIQAKCNTSGIGIVIEKGFQDGGKNIRNQGIKLESLVVVDSIENGVVKFR